jgi:hypothetical protein
MKGGLDRNMGRERGVCQGGEHKADVKQLILCLESQRLGVNVKKTIEHVSLKASILSNEGKDHRS